MFLMHWPRALAVSMGSHHLCLSRYVEDNGNGRQLVTDRVQLCVMQASPAKIVQGGDMGRVIVEGKLPKTIPKVWQVD